MSEMNTNRILVGKPEGKRPRGRPMCGWKDNIRMCIREVGWKGVDWIQLAEDWDRWRNLVNTVENLWVPLKTENFLTIRVTATFSRRCLLHEVS